MNIDFQKTITQNKKIFNNLLSSYARILQEINISCFNNKFCQIIEQYLTGGGKRFRPIMVRKSFDLFNKQKNKKSLNKVNELALSIEIVHAFLLCHDDIIDRDSVRHNLPTAHKLFEKLARKNNYSDTEHFGTSFAILMGDYLIQMGYQIILESTILSSQQKCKLLSILTECVKDTIQGQNQDVLLSYTRNFSAKDIEIIHEYKTARYTFETPMLMGAEIAHNLDENVDNISNFAIPAGIAFQIKDDVLGVFGDQKKTGKSSFSDLKEGKKTLLTFKAYEKANFEQKKILDKYLGKIDLSDEEAEEVRQIIRDTGSLDYSLEKCKMYIQKAQKALEKLPKNNKEAWQFLYELTEYLVVREV